MKAKSFGFTRKRLRDISPPTSGRDTYKDTSTKGLELRVSSSGYKCFTYRGTLNGKDVRVKIGEFEVFINLKDARKKASIYRAQILEGIDPNKAKHSKKLTNITLLDCLNDYLSLKTTLKPRTQKQYKNEITKYLASWLNKPLNSISSKDIVTRHRKITKNSPSVANRVMRLVRALYNFASQEYEDAEGNSLFPNNPVNKLSHQKLWNKIKRKQGVIKKHQLKAWFEATDELPDITEYGSTLKDYLQLIIFTGLRKNEAASLEWNNIDFKDKTLYVPITKNGKPHTLPLSNYLYKLLKRRYKHKTNSYVFPARYGEKHLTTPQKGILRVRDIANLYFTLHDLRRTFITIAESLDISPYAVKKLVNHSMSNDVTADYIVWDIDRLRKPMQQITDFIITKIEN